MRNIRDNSKSALTSSTGEVMSLKSVSASGRVSGLLLDMTVRQAYRNDTGKTLETVYSFPLAWGGVLLGLNVEIAGKRLTGVVMERKEAEHRYEEAVSDGDSPILLEQSSDGLFTVNLGSLKPGEEAVIEYHYAQLLNYEQNRIRVSVPTTIAPRYGDAERQGGIRPHEAVDADPLVEYPLELTLALTGDLAKGTVQSPSHSISTRCENGQLVVALARNAYLDRDFVLTVDGLAGRSLATIAGDGEGSVMLASFCPKITGSLRTAIGLKILIDCSGSMAGDSIHAARQALHQVLAELNPTDRFSYSRFGSNVEHAFDMLVPADDRHMRKASLFIDRTDADMGGTETEGALRSVFDLSHEDGETDGMDVLLITDGEVWNSEGIIDAARRSGHRIFAVGVGSAPAETLLRQLAEETGGACELVAPNEDIEAAIVRMFRRIRLPRANNLAVDWHTTPKWTTALPSALFDGETVHVFAGFEMIPHEPPVLSYAVDGSDKRKVVAPGLSQTEDDVLARLAASERLKQLPLESGLELSLQYQLVTRQTSLFLVHLREAEDKSGDLPHLQKIAHMQAAGWGGIGSVTAFSGGSNWNVSEVPLIMRSTRRNATLAGARDSGIDTPDIPAFLRRPADGLESDNHTRADLMSCLEQLLEVANKRLTHPDDLSSLIRAIKVYQEKFHPLFSLVEEIKPEVSNPDDAWVAFIAWADQQVGTEHRLTRHAERAMRVLVGAILENRLVAIMALLDAQMEKLSSDGWPQRHDQACSQVDANVLPDIFTVVFPG
jgi:Ca-activated chloride channel family protein